MSGPERWKVSILGASGAMGGLFARRMREVGWSVTGLDLREPASGGVFDEFVVGDATSLDAGSRAVIGRSDCVMICLPEEQAIRAALALPLPSSIELLVDTLSVKTPFFERLTSAELPCEHLSINPMFAPSVGFEGQAVAVVANQRIGQRGWTFIRMIEQWGARVASMSAERHDRLCAAMQAATHGALLALAEVCASGFEVKDLIAIAPPPHLICLSLAARIATAAPETYWDIQRHNPHAGELRRQLIAALTELDDAVEQDDYARFARTLEALKRRFGDDLERLTGAAAGAIRGASDALRSRGHG